MSWPRKVLPASSHVLSTPEEVGAPARSHFDPRTLKPQFRSLVVSGNAQLLTASRPTEHLELSRPGPCTSPGRPPPSAPGPRLTAGILEARGRAVPQRGAPARASLVLLQVLRVRGARRRGGGAGALGFVVRGGGRGGVGGGRRAVEGVTAAIRARLAKHVVRDMQALVARAGRLEQRRRPLPRAPTALGHGPCGRPRARPPERLPAARAGPRARAAARRPPPAQPAAQRPPPRARPARRLGRLGPSARGSALELGRRGLPTAAGSWSCGPDQAPPLPPPLRLLGARRVPARPPRGAPRSPADLPGREPPEAGPASSHLQPARQWEARTAQGGRGWAGPAPGTAPALPTRAQRGRRPGRWAGAGGRRRRPVSWPTGTYCPGRPSKAPRCSTGEREEPSGYEGDAACSSCRPGPLTVCRPSACSQGQAGAWELSAPVVLNQALRKGSR